MNSVENVPSDLLNAKRPDRWIVAQLGARENYSVARSLHRQGALGALITDLWADERPILSKLSKRFKERFHPELKDANVLAPSLGAIAHEITGKFSKQSGWDRIIERNKWFQSAVVKQLKSLDVDEHTVVFAYSYAAEDVLAFAKSRGATTVLGQIDPALAEAKLISDVYKSAELPFETPPEKYWETWQHETQLADLIVVNSEWSKQGLAQEGVDAEKIRILPLAAEFDVQKKAANVPCEFSSSRPLRLLFLGQVNLRKGIDLLLNAVLELGGAPIHLDVVGPVQVSIPPAAQKDQRIHFHGAVPRGRVIEFFRNTDIFVFPTRSDGFGLTQLEALAAGTPIIASKFCGDVVVDGCNGFRLANLTIESLVKTIDDLCGNPALVADMKKRADLSKKYGLDALGGSLLGLVDFK